MPLNDTFISDFNWLDPLFPLHTVLRTCSGIIHPNIVVLVSDSPFSGRPLGGDYSESSTFPLYPTADPHPCSPSSRKVPSSSFFEVPSNRSLTPLDFTAHTNLPHPTNTYITAPPPTLSHTHLLFFPTGARASGHPLCWRPCFFTVAGSWATSGNSTR